MKNLKILVIVLVEDINTSTIDIKPKITYNKKTNKEVKLFEGKCSSCKRTKTRIVSDNTIQAEGLQDFFKGLGKAAKNIGKKIVNNPTRALEIGTNLATAALTKNPKAIANSSSICNKVYYTMEKDYMLENLH